MKKTLKLIPFAINRMAWLCLFAWISGNAGYSCRAAESFNEGRPNEHFCPITLEVMQDPVVAADGNSYERKAILQHLNINHRPKSPITGLPLDNRDVFNNQALKIMISEWKPGRQREPSVLETKDAQSIAQRVREEFRKNATLLNSAKNQHIVAFLGNTGAGKSTLVNFLAGKEIIASSEGEDYVLADPDDATAMAIGTGGNSETLYPKTIDVNGLRFFDLPGFNDTDGSERNLVNAAFIRRILLDAASVRLVFVVGQDQFTADRSASVKQMFHAIKQLFVVGRQDISLIDDGVFVATKITCNEKTEMTDFLLRRTNARDKAELNEQLKSWGQRNRLCRMFHPLREKGNAGVREQILGLINSTKPAKVLGINVSVLYPPDTQGPLERMFFRIIEEAFNRKLNIPLSTLPDYDKAITFYSAGDFWQKFAADVGKKEQAIDLLKEFCINPYNKAFRNLEKEKEGKRQAHIEDLKNKKQQRIEDIERRTEIRTKEVISALVPQKEGDEFVAFDFAWHKDFYDHVCSLVSIQKLATDATEQEIVRRYYAGFISQHSHRQMMRWHQKFSGIEELTRRITTVEMKQAIPPVAYGYEEIYRRFVKGVLIYRPQEGSDVGRIDLPIAALTNPLGGTFDLSGCADSGKYLSISTGYRKRVRLENANKVEVWFTPRFIIKKKLNTTAGHFKDIYGLWKESAPIGIFWTWGGTSDLTDYNYVVGKTLDEISSNNLYIMEGQCTAHHIDDANTQFIAAMNGVPVTALPLGKIPLDTKNFMFIF